LFSFDFDPNGCNPSATLVQGKDGDFYGTTYSGGANVPADENGNGTVFKITPSGELTTLLSFNGINGGSSTVPLVQGATATFTVQHLALVRKVKERFLR